MSIEDNASQMRIAMAGRLRDAREYLGLSQEEVAAILRVPRPAVTNIEAGTRKVEAIELEQLAKLYVRPVDYFLRGEQSQSESKASFAARALHGLSDNDLEEVARFAEFLRASAGSKKSRGRK